MKLSSLDGIAKRCAKCEMWKALHDFPTRGKHDGRVKGECKECFRVRWNGWAAANRPAHRAAVARYRKANPERRLPDRLRKYGLTPDQARELLAEQDGKCPICARTVSLTGRTTHVDHDHGTNQVRSLLCRYCNVMLGQAFDDPSILRAAADYLDSHRGANHDVA